MGGNSFRKNLKLVRTWSMLDVLYNHIMILATISKQFEERITLDSNAATHSIFFRQWKFIVCSQWPMNKNVKLVEIKLRRFE